MEEQGVIVDIKAGRALVKTARGTACEGCVAKELCHIVGPEEMVIEADNPINASIGERVMIRVGPGVLLRASLILYLIPLLGFILGIVLGQELAKYLAPSWNPDLMSAIFGVGFLILSFLGIRFYGQWVERRKGYRPVVVRVV